MKFLVRLRGAASRPTRAASPRTFVAHRAPGHGALAKQATALSPRRARKRGCPGGGNSGGTLLLAAICAGLFAFWPGPARVQFSAPKVTKVQIKHVGPAAVSDEFIRGNIRVKPGDPYLPPAMDDDVHNLYATGFFYDIRVT